MTTDINRNHMKIRPQMRHHLIPTPGMKPRRVEQQQARLSAFATPFEPAKIALR
jgi:hypothetical protein